jgi:hypothetical protein
MFQPASRTAQVLAFPTPSPATPLRAAQPAAPALPWVELVLTDPGMKAWRLADNAFRLEGRTAADGTLASFAELDVEGLTVRCALGSGEGAVETCQRLAAVLPRGYRASLHPELPLGSCAFVLHRDDESRRASAAA